MAASVLQDAWCLLDPIPSSPIVIPAHSQPARAILPPAKKPKPRPPQQASSSQTGLPSATCLTLISSITPAGKLQKDVPMHAAAAATTISLSQPAARVPRAPTKPRKPAEKGKAAGAAAVKPPITSARFEHAAQTVPGGLDDIIGVQQVVWAKLGSAYWPAVVVYTEAVQVIFHSRSLSPARLYPVACTRPRQIHGYKAWGSPHGMWQGLQ